MRALAIVSILLLGCSVGTETKNLGAFRVELDHDTGQIGLFSEPSKLLLLAAPGGVEVGSGTVTWEYQFGAFQQVDATANTKPAQRLGATTLDGSAISFALQQKSQKADDALGTATITALDANHVNLKLTAAPNIAATQSAHRIRLRFACRPTEHFLGFGGQSFDVDHRGQNIPLWVSEDGIGKAANDRSSAGYFYEGKRHTTHTPLPVYLSSAGYGVVVNTPAYASFDLCAADDKWVTIEVWDHELDLHVFTAPTPREIVTQITAYLGRPKVPPAFTWAPWLDAIFGSENVRRVAHKLRDRGVPSAVIWTEDWRGGKSDTDGTYALDEKWEVDRVLYPDFEAVASELHDLGFKFLTYHNTFLDEDSATYTEAANLGHTIKDATGAPLKFTGIRFLPSTLADLSTSAGREWVKSKLKVGFTQGADGHMADFAEWLPTDAVLASGADPLLAHNRYPVEWAQLNAEAIAEQQALDGKERLFFVRAAHLGSQSQVSVVWAGDQQTDFSEGDGFPSVIPMGIGLGIAGFPYFAHDIAGYMSQRTVPVTRELWFRWVTFGALSPVMRTHHGRVPTLNWNWESDDASTDHFARWARLHMQLYPYLAALAQKAATTGEPMVQPLALQHPDFLPGWTAKDQYLLGDRIYVAPIMVEGATTRTVALPAGAYAPLLGGAPIVVDASGQVMLGAELGEIIALVRAGTVLPLLRADANVATTEPTTSVKYLDRSSEDRELWLWRGGDSTFDEGNGLTYEWRARDLVAGDVGSATYNDVPVTVTKAATGEEIIELVGPGTLVARGGLATLTIGAGINGSATRRVRLVVR